MSKDNNRSEKRFHLLPESNLLLAVVLVVIFAELIFMLFVLALDVLPFKYVMAVIIAILVFDLITFLLLGCRGKHTVKRIIGLILVMFMLQFLLVGDYYVYSTYDTLQKISKRQATWEVYRVMTLKDGSYNTVEDIEGLEVNCVDMYSKQLIEAKERLVTKESVIYDEEKSPIDVAHNLLDDDGDTHDGIILVSNTSLGVIKENIKGFGKATKTIYKIKVKKRANDTSKAVDVTEDSFNVLISGRDFWGKIDDVSGLSDVNMIMTVNPKTREVLLTSIPRDSYIPFHSYGMRDKLTHTGIYGEEETKATLEDYFGIDINYTIALNFSMLEDIVDAIDYIEVYNDQAFTSAIKDYYYPEGKITLKGKHAVYFARERKSFLDGDMKRNKNQQKVLKATIKKVTSSKVILTRYTKILNAVEDEMRTDMTDKDLKKLAKMQLRDMHKWTIHTANIVGPTGSAPCFSMGGQELSCVFPTDESLQECKEAIHDTMYPVDNTKKKNEKKKTDTEKDSKDNKDKKDKDSE